MLSVPKHNDKGFTLLEVIIAVAIIGVGLVMLLGSVNRNLDLASKSRDAQIAALLAQEMLNDIQLEGLPAIGEETGTFADHEGFEWFLTVAPYDLALIETNIRIVRLLIVWDQGNEEFEVFTAMSN
ncbi:MAG: type IV pilus modification PilV family protein [Thermodesulfobacteriota bacterium]